MDGAEQVETRDRDWPGRRPEGSHRGDSEADLVAYETTDLETGLAAKDFTGGENE